MTKDEIVKLSREKGIEFVRFLYVDNDGVIRGYMSHVGCLAGDLVSGHALAAAMPFFSALDTLVPDSRFGCVGEVRALPDPDTFRVAPYAPKTATVLCDIMTPELKPSGVCGRTALKNILAGTNYEIKASVENELYFMLPDGDGGYRPFDRSLCFASTGMQSTAPIISDIAGALTEQGLTVEKYYPEYGPGQQEIICRYDKALTAADNQVRLRETVRAVAAKHGVVASFMPKPFQNQAGSGGHLHVSVWDKGKNLFFDPRAPYKLSEFGLAFAGGILEHLRAICAFTAGIVTSYKRIVPHNWASCYSCWGPDNREAAVRVCSSQFGREEETLHFEVKVADAANNPYLAIGAILAAGLDGVKRGLTAGEPVLVDPSNLSPEERAKRNIKRLPQTLLEAAQALRKDTLYRDVLGEVFWDEYIMLKEFNWSEYNRQVSPWEIDKFATIF
jgi:glutamine synthetase